MPMLLWSVKGGEKGNLHRVKVIFGWTRKKSTGCKIQSGLGVIKPFDTLVPFNTRCSEHPIFPAVDASDFLRDHHFDLPQIGDDFSLEGTVTYLTIVTVMGSP
jgi:hypothetical protein